MPPSSQSRKQNQYEPHPYTVRKHLLSYSSSIDEYILEHPQIKLWTHGHTHEDFDYMLGTTRIVCNPRGYNSDGYSEDTGWNPNLILEI